MDIYTLPVLQQSGDLQMVVQAGVLCCLAQQLTPPNSQILLLPVLADFMQDLEEVIQWVQMEYGHPQLVQVVHGQGLRVPVEHQRVGMRTDHMEEWFLGLPRVMRRLFMYFIGMVQLQVAEPPLPKQIFSN